MPLLYRLRPKDLRSLTIESPRLRLRAISDQYTGDIYRHFTADITRYMFPAPASEVSQTQAFVASALEGLDRGDDLHFVICRRDDDEFLGVCGLHGEGPAAEPELGIWLKKAAHGHRYGREAIAALRTWAREHIDFERLIYPVDRRNIPSRRIAEHLGGVVIDEKKVMSLGGLELDEVVYAIPLQGQAAGLASGQGSGTRSSFVPPSLSVGKYLLRPFNRKDAAAWYSYLTDPRVTEHTSWPAITPDGIAALVDRVIGDYPTRASLRWALVRRDDGQLVGSCGFIRFGDGDGVAELAYDLSPACWGLGLMSAAVRVALDWAFTAGSLRRVQALAMTSNTKSIALLERTGFRREALLPEFRMARGVSKDFYLYQARAGHQSGASTGAGPAVEIRPLRPSESLQELTDLLHNAYAELGQSGLNYTAVDQPASTTRERIRDGRCLVAVEEGRLVGTVVVRGTSQYNAEYPYFSKAGVASAHQMAVAPDHQGRGLGSTLLDLSEWWAREIGFAELALDTAESADHLVAWYVRRGYRPVDTVQGDGKRYRSVFLAKRLGNGH